MIGGSQPVGKETSDGSPGGRSLGAFIEQADATLRGLMSSRLWRDVNGDACQPSYSDRAPSRVSPCPRRPVAHEDHDASGPTRSSARMTVAMLAVALTTNRRRCCRRTRARESRVTQAGALQMSTGTWPHATGAQTIRSRDAGRVLQPKALLGSCRPVPRHARGSPSLVAGAITALTNDSSNRRDAGGRVVPDRVRWSST
jgi:hypothetical protein